jgi:hypothetical protein
MKKKVFIYGLLTILAILAYSGMANAALGISPAVTRMNFAAGEERILTYTIYSDNPDQKIDLYAEGDLSQYVSFSRNEMTGGGSAIVTISFPKQMPIPGKHRLLIGAREIVGESRFIGTSINIRAVISIYVPYPGKYIESELIIPDGNVGEMIPADLKVTNRGRETLVVSPEIHFFDAAGNPVNKMTFNPKEMVSGEEKEFIEGWNTTNYKPGKYSAEAIISYSGEIARINKTIKIGSLLVRVDNFTTSVYKDVINQFLIGVTSEWNDNVAEIYAEINISNSTFSTSFRTPSVDLLAWESKTIVGFFDASQLKEGSYQSKIALVYNEQKTFTSGTLEVFEKNSILNTILYAGIGVLAVAIWIVAFLIARRMFKSRKRR